MAAPARHSTAAFDYDAFDAVQPYVHDELSPGERIGRPPARRTGKAVLRGVVLLITLGGGWLLLAEQPIWPGWNWPAWPSAEIAAVSSWLDRRLRPAEQAAAPNTESGKKPASLDPPPSDQQPLASTMVAATAAIPAVAAMTPAALPPPAVGSDKPSTASLPPPADAADVYQMRAEAVGLHPGLSRVLLARLSDADYRNAGVAIQTAVSETPDTGVFVWPRQRKPEFALFRVRFVPGAAPDCRRYVVTVAKDGWVTTALPMEKCGSQPGGPRRH